MQIQIRSADGNIWRAFVWNTLQCCMLEMMTNVAAKSVNYFLIMLMNECVCVCVCVCARARVCACVRGMFLIFSDISTIVLVVRNSVCSM